MFDIRQDPFAKGDGDDEAIEEYIEGLLDVFQDSPEGQAHVAGGGELKWSHRFLHFALAHVGSPPAKMSVRDAREVLFELFPEKVSTDPESASDIVAELRAFWRFLGREYGLREAPRILDLLNAGAEKRLADALGDSSRFGIAKSFFMMGEKLGFDMTTEEGLAAFTAFYNRRLGNLVGGADPDDEDDEREPIREAAAAASAPPVRFRTREELRTRDKERRKRLQQALSRQRR